MYISRRALLRSTAFVWTAFLFAPFGKASAQEDMKAFVMNLVDRAIKDLTAADLSPKERSARLRHILDEFFDMESVAKFVLGVYWRQASEKERADFTKTFTEYMSVVYSKRFGEYTGQKILIDNIRQDSPEMSTVFTIIDAEGSDVKPRIDWIIRNKDGKMKLVDLRIEGISLSNTQRDEFTAVMAKTGGVPGLIKTLQDKIDVTLKAQQ